MEATSTRLLHCIQELPRSLKKSSCWPLWCLIPETKSERTQTTCPMLPVFCPQSSRCQSWGQRSHRGLKFSRLSETHDMINPQVMYDVMYIIMVEVSEPWTFAASGACLLVKNIQTTRFRHSMKHMPHALSPVSLSLGRQGSGKRYHCICIHNWSQLNASLANLETLWNPLLCHSHNLQCFSSSQMSIEHDCSFGGFGFSF